MSNLASTTLRTGAQAIGSHSRQAIPLAALMAALVFCTACQAESASAPAAKTAGKAPAEEPFRLGLPPGLPTPFRTGNCALDVVNGIAKPELALIITGNPMLAEGWAADANRGALPRSAWLVLAGEPLSFHAALELRRQRPDVAEALGRSSLSRSGFRVSATTRGLPVATYQLQIYSMDSRGALICDTHRTIRIAS